MNLEHTPDTPQLLTPYPGGDEHVAALGRASRQAGQLAGLLDRTRRTYAETTPPVLGRVLDLVTNQLGQMHVTFDRLAEDLADEGNSYGEAA